MSNVPDGYVHVFRKGASKRTLVLLHGTGGSEYDLLPFAEEIDPDASVLSIRGQLKESEMRRYFKLPENGIFDQNDLKLNAERMASFFGEAISYYAIDRAEVTWLGYSNGANLISALILTGLNVVERAVLLRPMPVVTAVVPSGLPSTRIFISSGLHDHLVTQEQTRRLVNMFEKAGSQVDISLIDSGHMLVNEDIDSTQKWYAQF